MSKTATRPLPLLARLRGRHGRVALWSIAVLAAFAGGWWLWYGGAAARAAAFVERHAVAATAHAGFAIRDVMVVGREQTDSDALMRAVGLTRGAPILAFDAAAAKQRVETLPWVRAAAIERVLPDTVLVRIEERRPMALWQHQGRVRLIDSEGREIADRDLARFNDLLLVVGTDAPAHAADLLRTLQTEPELLTRVEAAVRVGGRRWNVRLRDGVDVRLPEDDAAGAWRRLAEYDRSHHVLERDVEVLDMRLPDRLIVHRPDRPEAPPTPAARAEVPGRQT